MPPSSDENAPPVRPSWQELKARVAMLAARSPASSSVERPFPVVIQKPGGQALQPRLVQPTSLPTPPPSFESPRHRAPQRHRQASPSPRKGAASEVLLAGPTASTPVKAAPASVSKRTRDMRSPAAFTSPNPRLRKNGRAGSPSKDGNAASPSKAGRPASPSKSTDLHNWREEVEEEGSSSEDMDNSDVIPVVVGRQPSPAKAADPDASFVREARENGWDQGLPPSPVKTVYIVAPPLPRRRESTVPREDTSRLVPRPSNTPSLSARRGRRSTSVLTPPRSLPRLSATPCEPESPTDDPLLLHGPPKLEGLEEEDVDDTFAGVWVKREREEGGEESEGGEEDGESDGDGEMDRDVRNDSEEPQSFLDSIGGTIEESRGGLESDGEDEDRHDVEEAMHEYGYGDLDDGEGVVGDLSNGFGDGESEGGEEESREGGQLDEELEEELEEEEQEFDADSGEREQSHEASGEEQQPLEYSGDGEELLDDSEERAEPLGDSGELVHALSDEEVDDDAQEEEVDDAQEEELDDAQDEEQVEASAAPLSFEEQAQRLRQELTQLESQDGTDTTASDSEDEPEYVGTQFNPLPEDEEDVGSEAEQVESEEEEASSVLDLQDAADESKVEASISLAEDDIVEDEAHDTPGDVSMAQASEAGDDHDETDDATPDALEESLVDAALPAEDVSQASDSEEEDAVAQAVGGTRSPTPLLPATPALGLPRKHPLVAALQRESPSIHRASPSIHRASPSIHRFAIQTDGSMDVSHDTSALDDLSASLDSTSRTRAMMLSRDSRRPIIEISSLDGEAAARAAACLVLNHDYIRNGSLKGAAGGQLGDVSVQPGADLTLPELLMEKELDLVARRRTPRTSTVSVALPSTPSSPFIPGAFPKSARKRSPVAESLHDKLVRKALAKTGRQDASLDHFRISSWVSLEDVVSAAIVHEARIAHRQLGMSSAEAQKRAALNVDRRACLEAFYEAHGVRAAMRVETSQWSDLRMQHRCASLQRRYLRLLEQRHPGTLQGDEKAVLDDTRDASAWHRLEKRYEGWPGYAARTTEVSFSTPFRKGTHSTPAKEGLYPALPEVGQVEKPSVAPQPQASTSRVERPSQASSSSRVQAPSQVSSSSRVRAPSQVSSSSRVQAPSQTSSSSPTNTSTPIAAADSSTSFSSRSFADDVRDAAARLKASRKSRAVDITPAKSVGKSRQIDPSPVKGRHVSATPVKSRAAPSTPSMKALADRKRSELRQSWAQREVADVPRKAPTEPSKKVQAPLSRAASSYVQPTALLFLPDSSHAEARQKALQLAASRQNRLWKSPPSIRQNAAKRQMPSIGDVTASRSFWKQRDENEDLAQ